MSIISYVKKIADFICHNKAMLICSGLFVAYLLPFILLRQKAHFPINDNLDWFTCWTVLANSGKVFTLNSTIEQIMNGIPRSALPSGLNIITWLYMLMAPFRAYLVNMVIVHVAAYVGMYLLLNTYVLPDRKHNWIVWSVALCFGIIPFYSVYGLSIAGQPLLAYAFCNIYYHNRTVWNYVIIALFALYSSLPLAGVFICTVLLVVLIIDSVRLRMVNRDFLYSFLFLVACYFITEFWLIYGYVFNHGAASSRDEIDRIMLGQSKDLTGVQGLIADNFINGQYHAVSLHKIILFAALPLALIIGCIKKANLKLLMILLMVALLFSTIYGFRYWTEFMQLTAGISFLKAFQLQRFHWLHPLLWYVLFAMSLKIIVKIKRFGKILVTLLIAAQIFYLYGNNIEYSPQFKEAGIDVMENAWLYENISYAEFFSDDLFRQISDYIGRPKYEYRIVSIGLYPAITQYHGFYTLDGRLNIYPLEYKHKFRRIMADELAKNEVWRKYFDYWGITCYIFPAELDYLQVRKSYKLKLQTLRLDITALQALGCNYIFSAAEITNYRENKLEFLKLFRVEWYPWEIYLYKVPQVT